MIKSNENLDDEAMAFIEKADEDARKGHDLNVSMWQFDQVEQWSIDPDKAIITFILPTQTATGSAQVIGTFSTNDPHEIHGEVYNETFLWAWDHPGIPENLRKASYIVKEWGEKMRRPLITERVVPANEMTAYTNAALGAKLYGGFVYVAHTTPTTNMYIVFDNLKFTQRN